MSFLKPERLEENLSDDNIHKKINTNRKVHESIFKLLNSGLSIL